MTVLAAHHLKILKDVVSLPTGPFHEDLVQEFVMFFAQERGLPAVADRYGNIAIEYKSGNGVGPATPVAFSAHMDHPGFVVTDFDATERAGKAEFRGGTKKEMFPGCDLLIYANGQYIKARAVSGLSDGDRTKAQFPLFEFEADGNVSANDIGWFDVPFAKVSGDRLHTKSADDLAQVALQLCLLDLLMQSGGDAHVYCLFTRAEEVGFVGASGMLKSGAMPPDGVPVIVLECSKALPGFAEIGEGFVLRVGDRITLYDPDIDLWFCRVAADMQAAAKAAGKAETSGNGAGDGSADNGPTFKYQRALMAGGACEAALFARHRSRVGALALPLGNYHNIGAHDKPEPEIISLSDAANQIQFMEKLARSGFDGSATGEFSKRIADLHETLAGFLAGNQYANTRVSRP